MDSSTAIANKDDYKTKDASACSTAEQFHKLFYEAMDKRRHLVGKLYMDNAILSWNGHGMGNSTDIQNFYNNLAQTTHVIISLDATAIPDVAVGTQQAVMVQVGGNVRMRAEGRIVPIPFTQTFILCYHQEKWRIVSDTFRTQNPAGATVLH